MYKNVGFVSKLTLVRVQVQEPPSWIIKPSDLRGAELDKVEFKCSALGSPPPKYTWVDKDGIDATEKEGRYLKPVSYYQPSISNSEITRSKSL